MHDIYCPHCGGRFIGSDVVFDLSEHVLPLLYDDINDENKVKEYNFKFYADLESFQQHGTEDQETGLFCNSMIGPGPMDPWYQYRITREVLKEYIAERSRKKVSELEAVFSDSYSEGSEDDHIATQLMYIREMYSLFGDMNGVSVEDLNPRSGEYNIILGIFETIFCGDPKSVTLHISMYSCGRTSTEYPDICIPDVLFIRGQRARYQKRCRNCGTFFPLQYGYYKMMPVVMLGSHASGKTSYLLSLKYTLDTHFNTILPYDTEGKRENNVLIRTLDEDGEYTAFRNNLDYYAHVENPIKTDFSNIPILNLLVNDKIYCLIDWPGEKFINNVSNNYWDFIFETQRVLQHARYVMFFLEPQQINDNVLQEGMENVKFDPSDLANNLHAHLNCIAKPDRFKGLMIIANKYDELLREKDGTARDHFSEQFDEALSNKSDMDMITGRKWNEAAFAELNNLTKNFLHNMNPGLPAAFNAACGANQWSVSFLPVAPYGQTPQPNPGRNPQKGRPSLPHKEKLVMVPFLKMLNTDGVIR